MQCLSLCRCRCRTTTGSLRFKFSHVLSVLADLSWNLQEPGMIVGYIHRPTRRFSKLSVMKKFSPLLIIQTTSRLASTFRLRSTYASHSHLHTHGRHQVSRTAKTSYQIASAYTFDKRQNHLCIIESRFFTRASLILLRLHEPHRLYQKSNADPDTERYFQRLLPSSTSFGRFDRYRLPRLTAEFSMSFRLGC